MRTRYNTLTKSNNNFFPYRENHQFYTYSTSNTLRVAYVQSFDDAVEALGIDPKKVMTPFDVEAMKGGRRYRHNGNGTSDLYTSLIQLHPSDTLAHYQVDRNPLIHMKATSTHE